MYKVKTFDGENSIDKDFESKDEALEIFDTAVNSGNPAYLYKDGEMINNYDPSYDDYCERAAFGTACVYCGAHAGGGYCYLSPDGSHVMND